MNKYHHYFNGFVRLKCWDICKHEWDLEPHVKHALNDQHKRVYSHSKLEIRVVRETELVHHYYYILKLDVTADKTHPHIQNNPIAVSHHHHDHFDSRYYSRDEIVIKFGINIYSRWRTWSGFHQPRVNKQHSHCRFHSHHDDFLIFFEKMWWGGEKKNRLLLLQLHLAACSCSWSFLSFSRFCHFMKLLSTSKLNLLHQRLRLLLHHHDWRASNF